MVYLLFKATSTSIEATAYCIPVHKLTFENKSGSLFMDLKGTVLTLPN